MRIILTNDDGIDAPGLAALRIAAAGLGELVVVAPATGLSGCSHQVTTHRDLRVERRAADAYAIDGMPADCVRVALQHLVPDAAWVLSGINPGGNLGADVFHSGTVAAVREGAFHGVPGIAISHYQRRGMPIDWDQAAAWTRPVLAALIAAPPVAGGYWNCNLPHLASDAACPEVVRCAVDPSPLPLSFRIDGDVLRYNGDYHTRPRRPGMDVDVCFSGRIALSALAL